MPLPNGEWSVQSDPGGEPLSRHAEATGAVRAARDRARVVHAERVIVHDRYGRTHSRPRARPRRRRA